MGRQERAKQFPPHEINIAHATQRCVRQAFLAGIDAASGIDYSFRREWIRRRLEALVSVFAMDLLTYAILSSHLHVVIRNRPDIVALWSDEEVAMRWLRVFPGRRLEEHLAEPTESDVQRLVNDKVRLAKIRSRLSDISWFMRSLAEPIARRANHQDKRKGHFWEGRFQAQRIADEAGLLACAAYVDLNPIRAAMAESIDKSTFTSACDRIAGAAGQLIESAAFDRVPVSNEAAGEAIRNTSVAELAQQQAAKRQNPTGKKIARDAWLAPIALNPEILSSEPQPSDSGVRASDKGFLHMSSQHYLDLLRWTVEQESQRTADAIPEHLAKLLGGLGIAASMWRDFVWNFKKYFGTSGCAGSPPAMQADAQRSKLHWRRGQRKVSECFAVA